MRNGPGIVLAAIGTLCFGAVLGPEAPLIAIGSVVGMIFALFVRVGKREQSVLATAGSFSAISALFGGPIVGGMMLVEGGLSMGAALLPVLLPGFVAAAVGYVIFVGFGTWGGLHTQGLAVPNLPAYNGTHVYDLLVAVVVGILTAILIAYVRKGAEEVAGRGLTRCGLPLLLLGGGLAVGLVAQIAGWLGADSQEVLFSGQSAIPALGAASSTKIVLILLVGKAIGYAVSLGCGFRGGPVFPPIFVGIAIADLTHVWFGVSPTLAVAVGAAAGMTAVTRLLITPALFASLLVGTAGVDAVPAAVLAACAAWLTIHPLDRRARADAGVSASEKVFVSPGVVQPNRSVAWTIQPMSVTSAIRFHERRCSRPILRSAQIAPPDMPSKSFMTMRKRTSPASAACSRPADHVAVVLGGDPPVRLEPDHTFRQSVEPTDHGRLLSLESRRSPDVGDAARGRKGHDLPDMSSATGSGTYGESAAWRPQRPPVRPVLMLVRWLVDAAALLIAAALVPGVHVKSFGGALLAMLFITVLSLIVSPLLAALRLPYAAVLQFLLQLFFCAWLLKLAADIAPGQLEVDSFGWALLTVLAGVAIDVALVAFLGINQDDIYGLRVVERIARHSGEQVHTSVPGLLFLEIDGLAAPVLRRAMRDGSAPEMARWITEGNHRLVEWEPDFSSQTGASQAGILLGSNVDIPAFRWVEKETGTLMTCSAPADCAEIERRHASGKGLLIDGGASRGNLLSGEADHQILTVSRMEAERHANPGYRAFYANGFNVVRSLVLFFWEVILEWTAALRAIRRDVRPRGHRGGIYPFLRAVMCVIVRDLIVYGVLSDMMKGRPAVYATFSSYDEVAHHSGLERADTLEALRKLDQQFGRIARARRFAPRPYEIVVLSDHGQTQGATFKQRNGYGLADLVERSLSRGSVSGVAGGDEQHAMVGNAAREATGGGNDAKRSKNDVSDQEVVVLGSGNLGLVYLMEEKRRLTLEEIEERHPKLIPSLREHPHVGFMLARSSEHGALALGPRGIHYLDDDRFEGEDPLAGFSPNAAHHLRRTDSFEHVADLMINSFYDPQLEEGCAFEELISFHGGMGGPQTQPFVLYPSGFSSVADRQIVGAEALHAVLVGWRGALRAVEQAATRDTSAATPIMTSGER